MARDDLTEDPVVVLVEFHKYLDEMGRLSIVMWMSSGRHLIAIHLYNAIAMFLNVKYLITIHLKMFDDARAHHNMASCCVMILISDQFVSISLS